MKKQSRSLKNSFLIVSICVFLCGCPISEKALIYSTIHSFERACNRMDISDMLNCIEPTIADLFRLLPIPKDEEQRSEFLLNIVDVIYVIDADSANEIIDFFESVEIKVKNVEVGTRRATVDAILVYTIDGVKTEEYITIILLERGGKWYIASIY